MMDEIKSQLLQASGFFLSNCIPAQGATSSSVPKVVFAGLR